MSTTPTTPTLSASASGWKDFDNLDLGDDAEESNDPTWHWTRYETDDGEYYYFNRQTHVTTWKRPLHKGETPGQWTLACSSRATNCEQRYYIAEQDYKQGKFQDNPSGSPLGDFFNAKKDIKIHFKQAPEPATSSATKKISSLGNNIGSRGNLISIHVDANLTQNSGSNIKGYTNRCLIIALADILSIDRTQFYQEVIRSYNSQKSKMPADMEKSEKDEFALQIFNNKQIEHDLFFKYFQIYALNENGLIVTSPFNNGNLMFPKNKKSPIGASMSNNGIFIRPVNQIGEPVDITINTPVIYNIGNFHYEAGKNKITSEILELIKEHYQDYTEYTNLAPIKVVERNPYNYNLINKTVEDKFIANKNKKVTSKFNCRFDEGDQILYNGNQSTILYRESVPNDQTGINECESYVVINNSSKVISQERASDVNAQNRAPTSTSKTIQQILNDFLKGTHYEPNIQNIENYINNNGGNISAILQVALNKDVSGILSDPEKTTEKTKIENVIKGTTVISGGRKKSRRNRNKTKKSKKTRRSKKN